MVTGMEEITEQFKVWVSFYGLKLIGAVLTFVVGRWMAGMFRSVVAKVMEKRQVDPTISGFVTNITFMVTMALVVVASLQKLGVATTSFVAVIGAMGLAIGLAFQKSLSNFAAGFLLVLFRPFKVGDFIEAGGTAGIVEKIEVFTTTFKTPDNRTVIVPNSSIAGGNITNASARPTRRMEFIIGISYGDDLRKAKQVLLDAISVDERVLKDPAPAVFVTELGDSSVNLTARAWVASGDFWATKCDLTERIKLTFDEQDLTFPFPQRDVHLHTVAAAA
jgi:small conductance mechanosensitive channel